ncbi:MAG TPA: ATP-binding cassette domain-containing protein [Tepidisphaeraceae bacterium]|nr:ATP-binding cassette domain-containing protein [Tepidisphaeraceae bacterium]
MSSATVHSPRINRVADWFGLSPTDVAAHLAAPPDPQLPPDFAPAPGQLILITGPSGAGKSTLLRALRERHRRTEGLWIDLARLRLPDRPTVDVVADALAAGHRPACDARLATPIADADALTIRALESLSRVGLGEVWSYLRHPTQLSDGQRWRLRLAVGLARADRRPGGAILAADEFGALLDRITARVVARCVRRAVAGTGLSAVVATSHEDLIEALAPDVVVRCDFGRVTETRF